MANKKFWPGMLIMALVFGTIGCVNDTTPNKGSGGPGGSTGGSSGNITYTVEANGTLAEETTTQLTFTFSDKVDVLKAGDIYIGDGTGAASNKKTLTGDGTTWNLDIKVILGGTVKVQIMRTGIESGGKSVMVHQEGVTPADITYTVEADGKLAEEDSTQLTFTFDVAVSDLKADDITITNGTGEAKKGDLTGGGASWKLDITDIAAGTVEVIIAKTGIESGEKIVMVHKEGVTPDIDYTVTANGTVNAETTTQLTFTFIAEPSDLKVEDITITNDTGEASKGTLTGSGTSWQLDITDVVAGTVEVKIDKTGIESGEKTVTVHKKAITYTVTANGTPTEGTSTQLAFIFSEAVSGLKTTDITITNGTGKASKGNLTGSDTTWKLNITGVAAGIVMVKIAKAGIESGEKPVMLYKDIALGSDKEHAIKLTNSQYEEGSVAVAGDTIWYTFDAESGANYAVQWKNSNSRPAGEDYMAWIQVTAYESDGTTISNIAGEKYYGYTPRPVSGVSGKVYLKVEYYATPGTYAVRFYNLAGLPQVFITIDTARATIVPSVAVKWFVTPLSETGEVNVGGFRVYRSNTETGAYTKIGADYPITEFPLTSFPSNDVEKLNYIDRTVTAGNTYWYKVAAYNKEGVEGDMSDPVQSEEIPGPTETLPLTIGEEKSGSITDVDQVVWYTFMAESGKTYKVQWESAYDNRVGWMKGGYAVMKVSVFTGNKEIVDLTATYNNGGMAGWTAPGTVSGVSGTVYLKVELDQKADYAFGPYTIKVYKE